ncbi:amino acid ABC transporter ATPase [Gallibacterium anatis]|uniref:amino acid ABC transporter ATP-binding protein n=1 Tax=Gallibacterium anatis TaxID=750 RepID=UPI000530E370|nr:amino acid ABC transporter ATP-binding protein [Gallibacterium anatis]KGQ47349.1 amino acid ABC transporter ATPase [Gallibacterium anatis]KGQ48362.1 amino acid ABC transporter ATPase [Gallibacterium anatis 10672-6]
MLSINNLHKSFGDHEVLKGIDLRINKGEVIVLLGASGSGKTTLLRCLNVLETPDAGTLTFDDGSLSIDFSQPLTKEKIQALRKKSGMVFQNYNLFPHKTALENITEGLIVVQKMPKAEAEQKARHLLERVELADKADFYPFQLSGGQQQRIGIARALAIEPQLVLFDEPTSALDPELVQGMLALMKSLAAEGWTMVIVTHEIQFAREVADQVILMGDGKIIEQDTPEQLFEYSTNPRTNAFLRSIRR